MAVDIPLVTDQVSQLKLESDENGIISAFGVYLTYMFSEYYCETSFEFERAFKEQVPKEIQDAAKQLLIESGHVCGFNTFGGIMKSDAWKAVVKPMIESDDDWIRGMIGVINTLGWGKYQVVEFDGKQKLVVEIADGYEAECFIKRYGATADDGKCYLAVGASVALMNLVYVGNIQAEPVLDEDFYNHLFHDAPKYIGTEVKCKAKGDAICQIEISST